MLLTNHILELLLNYSFYNHTKSSILQAKKNQHLPLPKSIQDDL